MALSTMAYKTVRGAAREVEFAGRQGSPTHPAFLLSRQWDIFEVSVGKARVVTGRVIPVVSSANAGTILAEGPISAHLTSCLVEI